MRASAFVLCFFAVSARAEEPRTATVGLPGRISRLVLPGAELEARPLEDRKTPVVVRILNASRQDIGYRYDLLWYGLEPGTFDLRDYLRRADGSSTADLPPLPVTVRPLLPPGQVTPNPLEANGVPWLGGYRLALAVGAVLWMAGLFAILFVGQRKKAAVAGHGTHGRTLADRVRPLVEKARSNSLSRGERAELERILLAYWRGRLGLGDRKPAEAFALLRSHPEAGPLLEQLEAWLHRPGAAADVDIARLLRPYEALPAETANAEPAREGVPA